MNEQTEPKAGTFEIGLVMAGAISAGAYTAGVISFLMEALDAWYREKKEGNGTVPQHDVTIKAISGTSAGGMTAGILGLSLFRDIPTVSNPELDTHSQNPLFDAWVNMADIGGLLKQEDRYDSELVSLLDSTLLDRIANRIFSTDLPFRKRPYIDPSLHLILCMTNLRGVPYQLPFDGDVEHGHQMTMHADHLHFILSGNDKKDHPETRSCHILNPLDKSDDQWDLLRQGCLASGAFPLGLASRKVVVDLEKYEGRIQNDADCAIKPAWPKSLQNDRHPNKYAFWASDGGLFNNEPFDLARLALEANDPLQANGPDHVKRIIIMIDPFVGRSDDEFADDTSKRPSFASVGLDILNALRSQARFKADELAQAWDPKVNNRFLIAPTRSADGIKLTDDRAIASGALGGFSGFFSREFRVHDYLLGRRNCQKFLRDRLVLEVKPGEINDVFGIDYAEADRRGWLKWHENENRWVLPIIPLVGDFGKDPGRPVWPVLWPDKYDFIERQIKSRLDFVVRKWSSSAGFCVWTLVQIAWWLCFARRSVRKKIMNHIRNELNGRKLWKNVD